MSWFFSITAYIWLAICLQMIAKKTSTPDDWLAWIPIANIYLLCKVAGRSGWWTLVFFVPPLNLAIAVIWWWIVAEKRNKPGWLGILMLVPGANLIVPGVLAFSE
ncbi:DUF5684 domain-containing protein [Chloroflexota bacterium]